MRWRSTLIECTCDMSVLDVLVHTVGARAAKIRLDKLKESAAVRMTQSSVCIPITCSTPLMTSHLKIRRPVRRRKRGRLKRPCGQVAVWGGDCTKS